MAATFLASAQPSLGRSSFLPLALKHPRTTRLPSPPPLALGVGVRSPSSGGHRSALAMELPHLSPVQRGLMARLIASVEEKLGPDLLPPQPADTFCFEYEPGSAKGEIGIANGSSASMVDFVLQAWLHCKIPHGALDIITLLVFLKPNATNAPHLFLEMVQGGSKSLVLCADFLPRKDLLLHEDYLESYYRQTLVDKPREDLFSCSNVKPYVSPFLRTRAVFSPTAILASIKCETEGEMEEMLGDHVGPATREMVALWLENCALTRREVDEEERKVLEMRDASIKRAAIDADLAQNLPRLFGEDVARQVLEFARSVYRI